MAVYGLTFHDLINLYIINTHLWTKWNDTGHQKWYLVEKLQELTCSVAMETFIRNITKLFIFQHLSIDVNESHRNSETYISGCRWKFFSIKYGCLSLKAKSPYSTYEKLPWKQKSCHIILFPIYWVKTVTCLKGWLSSDHILCKLFGIEEVYFCQFS